MIRRSWRPADLSDPSAAKYLADVLIKRRDKVVAYWIVRTNPLDDSRCRAARTARALTFDNAAVRVGVASPKATYRVRWSSFDNAAGRASAPGDEASVTDCRAAVPASAWGPRDASGARYAVASIAAVHPDYPHWTRPVQVTVRDRQGAVDVVGIERPTGGDRGR